MTEAPKPLPDAARLHAGPALVREVLLVLIAGGLFALAANFLSPRGLSLRRDYFPSAVAIGSSNRVVTAAVSPSNTSSNAAPDPVVARLRSKGLQAVDVGQMEAWFRDPRYLQGLIVFVDARTDFLYQVGHIPGAHPFDHYHPGARLGEVMMVANGAELVALYCTGGDCEDSEFAALMLNQAGIPAERLFIYVGGITEWTERKLPVEVGMRGGVSKGGGP